MITITINKLPTFYIDMDLVENIFVFFVQKARKILILNIDFHIDFRPSTFGHVFVFLDPRHACLAVAVLADRGARHFSKPVVDQGLLI